MRGFILKIHLVLALIAGAFMVVLGLTGSVIAFEPELDRLFHAAVSYVEPGSKVLSLTEIGATVSLKYSGEPIVAYAPSTSPDTPTEVILSRGIVSANQYTGEVLGIRTRGQTFLGFVRALHVRLAAGDVGRNVLKWSAVAMLFSLASGLYLWWPRKRVRFHGPWRSPGFWFDLHNAIGIFALLPLLVLAATGTVLGFEDQVSSMLDKICGTPPPHSIPAPKSASAARSNSEITPDQAVAIALAALPGTVAYRVQMPRYGGLYVVSLTYLDNRIAAGRNFISVDPRSGAIASADLSTSLTARERFMITNEALHTGNFFGASSRIIMSLSGILLPLQAVSGLLMWGRRTKISRR